jgi:hypothetical protein
MGLLANHITCQIFDVNLPGAQPFSLVKQRANKKAMLRVICHQQLAMARQIQ